MWIIQRYIVKEILPWFIVGVAFFEVIMLAQQVFRLVDMHVRDHVPLEDIMQLFLYTIPFTTQLTIPLGVMVGTLMAISRLSGDEEITAMRACGMSLLRIFVPTFIFGIVITLSHLAFVEWVVPWGNRNYVKTYREIMQVDPTLILMAESSLSRVDYIVQVDLVNHKDRSMEMIRIIDKQNNKMIMARSGRFGEKDKDKNAFPLHLEQTTTQRWHYNPLNKKDEEGFWEKTNEELTIYIPDQRRKQDFDPFNTKSWAITYLWQKIQEKKNENLFAKLGQINELAHKMVELRDLEQRYYNIEGNFPDYSQPPFLEEEVTPPPSHPKNEPSTHPTKPPVPEEVIPQGAVPNEEDPSRAPPEEPPNQGNSIQPDEQAEEVDGYDSEASEQGSPEDNTGPGKDKNEEHKSNRDSSSEKEEPTRRTDQSPTNQALEMIRQGATQGMPSEEQRQAAEQIINAQDTEIPSVKPTTSEEETVESTLSLDDIIRRLKRQQREIEAQKTRIQTLDRPKRDDMLNHYQYEFHVKVAIPFACLAFTLISAPLGIFSGRLGKSLGLLFCIIIAILWFGLRILTNVLFEEEILSAALAAWSPNIVLFITGITLAIIKMRG
jgi:lipopolysaccharide export LptBFGC system permease protein LptF